MFEALQHEGEIDAIQVNTDAAAKVLLGDKGSSAATREWIENDAGLYGRYATGTGRLPASGFRGNGALPLYYRGEMDSRIMSFAIGKRGAVKVGRRSFFFRNNPLPW